MAVIKISKSGNDVQTASVEKMILHSDYPTFKLKQSGTGTITTSIYSGAGSATIAHNLGYIPFCMVYGHYIDESTGNVTARYKPFSFWSTPGLNQFDYFQFYADTTNLYISVITSYWVGTALSFPYIYYIFYDPEQP